MLANERLILKMSLEQKVKFVTSLNAYESSSAGSYEFPVFKLEGQPYEDCPEVYATRFPSDKALASTWNTKLISEVYNAVGEEAKRVHPFGYFNNCDDYTFEEVSNDNFVTAKFVLARQLGLSRSGKAVNFEMTRVEDGEHTYDKKFVSDTLLTEVKPTSILVTDTADIEDITKRYKYKGMFYGAASSVEECVKMLYAGCSLVFIAEDFTAELTNYLTERTEAYLRAYKKYRDGDMTLEEFDRRVRNFEIFDEEILNTACDRLVSLLVEMKEDGENIPPMSGLDENRVAKFDEISHDEIALNAARESVVLVKNDGILPLTLRTKLAVAGAYASDFSYQKEQFGGNPTARILAIEAINEYDGITATGFALGYAKGQSGRTDLTGYATELASNSDCTLVYLCAGKGETSIPQEQMELLNALYLKGQGIIAVVACDSDIDLSFADKCKAVLLTYNCGQEGTSAVLDIISGLVCPSGKLTEEIFKPNGEVMYPFGYGLSYTKFEYRNLKVNTGGLSFTVENTGDCDGYSSVQLYIKNEETTNFFRNKTLRGFAKTFVKKGDAVTVEIPFDENTFKAYNDYKKCYAIEGGEYEIIIAENYDNVKLSGSVILHSHIYKDSFENEVVETSKGVGISFTGDKEKDAYIKARKKLSFGVKLFVALMLGIYYNALIGVFAFTPVISDKTTLLYVILGAVAGVLDLILLIYIVVISKNRAKQLYLHENEVLTDMIGQIDEFKEIAKVTYAQPVSEEDEEEENTAGEDESGNPFFTKKPEVVAERTYDASFRESEEEEEVVFTEHISLPELCSNLREFALSNGVNIEITSVRAIISAVASSKIVILKSANAEVLPEFLSVLSAYFGYAVISEASPAWTNAGDLMWRAVGDRYVLSEFANAVHGAEKSPAKMCASILTNVSAENILNYFGDFIDYANHPSEEHEIKISNDIDIKLPNNMTYFIVPEDGASVFPKEVINASALVELALSKADKGESTEVKNVAVAEFEELVTTARGEFFLPERIWKRIDELVSTVGATEKFEIGNKNTLQTEKLTSVIMECGGDESEAFIQMLISKLIPILKTTRAYKQEGGDRTLAGIIEKLFPEEELAKIKKALIKLN